MAAAAMTILLLRHLDSANFRLSAARYKRELLIQPLYFGHDLTNMTYTTHPIVVSLGLLSLTSLPRVTLIQPKKLF